MPPESFDNYFVPAGTDVVLNMPYPCNGSERCAPYKVVLKPGEYEIEVWGASGGDVISTNGRFIRGGLGGYVRGILEATKSLSLYFYIGSRGLKALEAYNGGGRGPLYVGSYDGQGTGGGGCSDVRLFPSILDEERSMNERIAVAGAGGGSCSLLDGARGGHNLRLVGESGYVVGPDSIIAPSGGKQNDAGKGFIAQSNGVSGKDGNLGKGGDVEKSAGTNAGAGGCGFYGGGGGGWINRIASSGAAGSSFASGCEGCKEVEGLPKLKNIVILGGNETMPSPNGNEEEGHFGNGYGRIRVINGGFVKLNRDPKRKFCRSFIGLSVMLLWI